MPQADVVTPGAGTPTSGLTPGLASSTEPGGIVLPLALPGTWTPAAGVFASVPEAAPVLQLLPMAVPSEAVPASPRSPS